MTEIIAVNCENREGATVNIGHKQIFSQIMFGGIFVRHC